MQWVTSDRDESGTAITVDDPLAATFATIRGPAADRVRALLAIDAIFPCELADDESFAAALTADVERLGSGGAGRILAS
jgi:mannitol-1-phosphate/altronate dehydrogenase